MTSSSDPVGQVDPDLAEAERRMRWLTSGGMRTHTAETGMLLAAARSVLREYDRLRRIEAAAREYFARATTTGQTFTGQEWRTSHSQAAMDALAEDVEKPDA